MPSTNAIQFWTDVATMYKNNTAIIFDLFNEPYPGDWGCWLNGGSCSGINYQVAGMQSMLTAVRDAGATNLIMLGGLA